MIALPLDEIDRLIAEDVPSGDLTTDALGFGAQPAYLAFRARGDMVVVGTEIAAQILTRCGADSVNIAVASGTKVAAGTVLIRSSGPAAALHAAWKVAQTTLDTLSGVATATRAMADAAAAVNPDVRIATTRKAFPGTRRFAHFAVRAGGGIVHRHGLSETVLIFAEHLAFLPNETFADLAKRLRREAPEKKLAIEVTDTARAKAAIEAGFDMVQLDKMTPDGVREVAAMAAGTNVLVAAAGGVNLANVADYVAAGAGLIVTTSPYWAPPKDVQVELRPLRVQERIV